MVRKEAKQQEDPIDRALALAATDAGMRAEKKRKQLSHGLWGYTEALPESVLFRSAEQDLLALTQQLTKRLGKPGPDAPATADLLVYGTDDFDAVETAAATAAETLEMASSYLIIDDPEEKNTLLSQMLSKPTTVADFAERIRRS